MSRLVFAGLALALCAVTLLVASYQPGGGSPPPSLPEDARAALETDGPKAALRLIRDAAESGDYGATRSLATIYRRGYLQSSEDGLHRNSPVFVWPGQARRWERRYERLRDQLAREGDLQAQLDLAGSLRQPSFEGGIWIPATQAQHDSADAITQRLADAGMPSALLVRGLNLRQGAPEQADSLLALAEATGVGGACFWRTYRPFEEIGTAVAFDAYADEIERCYDPEDHRTDQLGHFLRDMRRARDNGVEAASVMLDSLHQLGLFERHPRLTTEPPGERNG